MKKSRIRVIKRKQSLSQEANKVIFNLVITLGIIIVVLTVTFITTSSKSSQQGYVLKQAQIENDKLRINSEELKTQLVKVQSFQTIQEEVEGMIEPETKEYIVP